MSKNLDIRNYEKKIADLESSLESERSMNMNEQRYSSRLGKEIGELKEDNKLLKETINSFNRILKSLKSN